MNENDVLVSQAFSNQSIVFDELDAKNKLTEHLRNIYRAEIIHQIQPNSQILELNCGTGIDTIYLANQGHHLFATDNALGMLDRLKDKIKTLHLADQIKTQHLSFENLNNLEEQKFDYIISNFGGLNCTGHLSDVLNQFKNHLTENGKVTLVIMPKISPWELIMFFKGKFKTAFRRFKKDTSAHVEGIYFSVSYYNPSYVIKALQQDFNLLTHKGIYFAVPPEFYLYFVERYPRLYKLLQKIESKLASIFPFNYCCDHYMITFQLKTNTK